jgi:hypothetical protein
MVEILSCDVDALTAPFSALLISCVGIVSIVGLPWLHHTRVPSLADVMM